MKLTPRHKPSWATWQGSRNEVLVGYVNDLDIYYEDQTEDGGFEYIFIVGPKDRKLQATQYNFDSFVIEGNALSGESQYRQDIHVDLHEMCLIYQLAVERGCIKTEEEDGIQE